MFVFFALLAASHKLTTRTGNLEDLIQHGLRALNETLQKDKELTENNTSIGIIGPATYQDGKFHIVEGGGVKEYLAKMNRATLEVTPAPVPPAPEDADVQMSE